MIDAFYTAAVGTVQLQKGFDVVGNNVANVSTAGFKKDNTSFADLLYTNIRASEEDTNLKLGHGAKLHKTDVLHTQGMMLPTGRDMDYTIEGNGFFAVETLEGIKYTRCGNFEKSYIGGTAYLTALQGGYVLDSKGQRIELTGPVTEIVKDNNGKEVEKIVEQVIDIGVYDFKNTDALEKEGGLFFIANERTGEAAAVENPSLRQRYLEGSNVDLAQSMSDIITLQRAFQFNSRMVQISDEVMQTVNTLRS